MSVAVFRVWSADTPPDRAPFDRPLCAAASSGRNSGWKLLLDCPPIQRWAGPWFGPWGDDNRALSFIWIGYIYHKYNDMACEHLAA